MTLNKETKVSFVAKPLVFAAALLPLAWIVWRALVAGDLGANPVETVNRHFGDWALRFLILSLAVSPLVHWTGQATLVRFRRMIGLFAFFYATLHIANYVVADQFFNWTDIWADIVKRRYITVGMIVFALLTPLALTSTKGMIKRLGAKRWRALHRIVYIAAIGGVFHYWMMIKADFTQPALHALVLGLLLGHRLYRRVSAEKPPARERPRPRRKQGLQAI